MRTYAVIGLGYVGLGLATALSKKNIVFGYDNNNKRIEELNHHIDRNKQVDTSELLSTRVTYTSNIYDIQHADFYIVCVSTPAYYYEIPNLEPLLGATKALGALLKKGDIVVYESTVYPGTTLEICLPLLEETSRLKGGTDFHVGYSPERINPGDKENHLHNITKIISAQNEPTLQALHEAYGSICDTIHPVSSIPVAEAIKILENTQRDVNIAFMNEFTKIMHALNLNTHEIIEGAKTKFGFVPYKPGFVGGHCISIDPHYLAFDAKRHGVRPELITTARRVNDDMTQFVVQSLVKLLFKHQIDPTQATVGIFGISYKANIVDTRNSLAFKLIKELKEYGFHCRVHSPFEHPPQSVPLEHFDDITNLTAAIVIVAHDFYKDHLSDLLDKCKQPKVLMDIPNMFVNESRLLENTHYWAL
ncbi:MAG: nucleotide sugar dehydrogenase [Legionellales bacterium]|nr:nucleotide sugar dehydrogenase [Legionellales bacterium]